MTTKNTLNNTKIVLGIIALIVAGVLGIQAMASKEVKIHDNSFDSHLDIRSSMARIDSSISSIEYTLDNINHWLIDQHPKEVRAAVDSIKIAIREAAGKK